MSMTEDATTRRTRFDCGRTIVCFDEAIEYAGALSGCVRFQKTTVRQLFSLGAPVISVNQSNLGGDVGVVRDLLVRLFVAGEDFLQVADDSD